MSLVLIFRTIQLEATNHLAILLILNWSMRMTDWRKHWLKGNPLCLSWSVVSVTLCPLVPLLSFPLYIYIVLSATSMLRAFSSTYVMTESSVWLSVLRMQRSGKQNCKHWKTTMQNWLLLYKKARLMLKNGKSSWIITKKKICDLKRRWLYISSLLQTFI